MILAPTLSLNAPARGYDADATAFAAASGATDVAALSAFVKGVKDLGLWDNMVCWPLRSSQNAGSGTTAYSFGGLGTYNGTLNGPTWATDGLSFDGSNDFVTITAAVSLPATWMCAVDFEAQAFRNIFSHDGGVAFSNGSVLLAPEQASTWYFQTVSNLTQVAQGTRTLTLGSMAWASFSVRQNPDTSLMRVNGSTATMTATGTIPSLSRLFLGRRSDGLYANMTLPFFGLINSYQDTDALRSLYKSTLGTGLGLP